MTASSAMPDSRNRWSVAGIFASAKAKRSRRGTGEVWWLKPMTTKGMVSRVGVGMMEGREHVDSPKGQHQKNKTAEGAQGEAPAPLGEAPIEHQQGQVDQPNEERIDYFRVAREIDVARLL